MKLYTVQGPPDVGGVTPDSKPPSWIIPRESQVVEAEKTRLANADRMKAKRIVAAGCSEKDKQVLQMCRFARSYTFSLISSSWETTGLYHPLPKGNA